MPDRLFFTDSDEANALIASDPMALLVGFALDQQVPVPKAFSGPLVIKQRLGSLDPKKLVKADLDPIFREKPAIHRFPGKMAERVHDLAEHVVREYDGRAERVWTDAGDSDALRANIEGLPGFGEMKVKALGSVLAKRFGVKAAKGLVPPHPTLGDVDSPQALLDYQAAKRARKAEWKKMSH
ncbi:MAG TPA: HhH-GPD-type base excision DNA repair protein [Solirubrobacteraceae bacterium]|nr:HhH-GPD-type base excision DNA repair protein [Solirubrobacteraceae bacterium]